ncbi:MAG: YegS/Rv2252/BmrU family lipid kinase [Bacteroidales bacterium]|nr:YegS/Rv2252/BmrU family lipid kinase [Bacteroidales bacterium]
MKKVAFILNPISGTGRKKVILDYIQKEAAFYPDYQIEFYSTKCVGDACVAARGFVEKEYDIVVAIGGDGTVNEVAEGLIGSNAQLGIIPVGSGNGLARHLNIPLNYQRAVDAIFNGRPQFIDAGKINGKVFFCTAGIGFDAVVGEKFNSSGSRGLMTYVEFCTKEYVKYRPEKYMIAMNGSRFETKAFLITFANSSQWGNNAFIAPDANISDGMMDIVVWKEAPRATMPLLTAELFLKTLKYSQFVDTYRCKELLIIREKEGLVQFDGESVMMGNELSLSVLHKAVQVIVPKDWRPLPQIIDMLPQYFKDMVPQQWKEIVPKLKDMVK